VSFGLTVTDDKKKSLFHNAELREVLVKTLSMKARWQAKKLKETGIDCIISIDEPYLTSIGSSFVSLNKEDAFTALGEIVYAIHKEGALAAMHCCGNTDWGFLLTTGIDILSFDAYNFYESLSLYPKEISDFLKKGGLLAWGLIPNTQDILKENYNTLSERLRRAVDLFVKKGIAKADLLDNMLITPSCGLGLMEEYLSDIVLENTAGFSSRMREANGK
jgi:methionine synthase II (cobalamin-independent)